MGGEALPKIGAQHRERHLAETRQQQGLRVLERLAERGIHRLLDQASRRFGAVADREQRRAPERGV
ncbi:MAG TPA: hypothetical protein VFS15_16215, partial [Kofleriaceae bacterium]|nr:hypothetical protein [Kofleriaceae bacterium]